MRTIIAIIILVTLAAGFAFATSESLTFEPDVSRLSAEQAKRLDAYVRLLPKQGQGRLKITIQAGSQEPQTALIRGEIVKNYLAAQVPKAQIVVQVTLSAVEGVLIESGYMLVPQTLAWQLLILVLMMSIGILLGLLYCWQTNNCRRNKIDDAKGVVHHADERWPKEVKKVKTEFWLKNGFFRLQVEISDGYWCYEHPLYKIQLAYESAEDFREQVLELLKADYSSREGQRILTIALIKAGLLQLVKVRLLINEQRYDFFPQRRGNELLSPHIHAGSGRPAGFFDPVLLEASVRSELSRRAKALSSTDFLKITGLHLVRGEEP